MLLVFLGNINSQTCTVTLGSATPCNGDTILIPINVTNFNNIGAITLYIKYDTAVLEYDTIVNVHSQTPGTLSNNILTPYPKIGIAWFSMSSIPANIGTGKYLDIQFIYHGGTDTLLFEPNCEIADINASILNTAFYNGIINHGVIPAIISQPVDTIVYLGYSTCFKVISVNVTSYQWEVSADTGLTWSQITGSTIYSNGNSDTLCINNAPMSLNGNLYRCYLDNQCPVYSNPAKLTVDGSVKIENRSYDTKISLNNYPNPFSNNTTIEYTLSDPAKVIIDVYNNIGEKLINLVNRSLNSGVHETCFNATGLSPGFYLCKIQVTGDRNFYSKSIIMIVTK